LKGKLRYGIIGTGNIAGWKHLTGYSELREDVEITAACDTNEKRLKEVGQKYNIPHLFTDYNDLLALNEIDMVSICLPNYLHAPVTIKALKSGKHVHCEKPMAMNENEALEMLKAKNETGRKLMIGLNNRFTPTSTFVKKYIDGGNLGDIYFAKCGWIRRKGLPSNAWFQSKELSGGGPLIDLGVHYIDLVMYFLDYPELVSAVARKYKKFGGTEAAPLYSYKDGSQADWKYDVEDFVAGFLELKNDVSVSFEISWASNVEKELMFYEIYGNKANIRFSNWEVDIFTVINGEFADIHPKIETAVYSETEFKHFIKCIRTGCEPSISNIEQCVKMMKIVDAVYRSTEERKQINL
jgi:predicted dehydrogenase